jgi:hypothetical protein
MASITVNSSDVEFADKFLTTYLSDKIIDADFSEGSVVRDFVIKAIAYMFAYLQKEIKTVKDRQSLLRLSKLTNEDDIDESVDAILSNWFLSRLPGRSAQLPSVVLHFNRLTDIPIPAGTRFYRTNSLIFVQPTSAIIPRRELRPTISSDGVIVDYTRTVTLNAEKIGAEYNILPGKFLAADPFSPYFLYAENTVEGRDGVTPETTTQILARAQTAIAVRNLVNERSIFTVLRQQFPSISDLRVIGYSDPEMLRDQVLAGLSQLRIHTGGHTDIYINSSRTDVTETLPIGGLFARPDNVNIILRDTSGINFVDEGVTAGDVLQIRSGLPSIPRDHIIVAVGSDYLEVQSRLPFPVATDENDPMTYVTYTIGNLAPGFDNILGGVAPLTTGVTSRQMNEPQTVIISGRPHYKIKRVEVVNGPTVTELDTRVNSAPDLGEYQLVETNIPAAQSIASVTKVIVNDAYSGNLRITYETLTDYNEVQGYVTDRFERVICSNPLVKAMHPVYIDLTFRYKLASTAKEILDIDAIRQTISTFINAHKGLDVLSLSSIRTHIHNEFPSIGIIYEPFTLRYKLLAPDGQIYYYTTSDTISVRPNWPDNTAKLLNGLELRESIVNADLDPTLSSENEAALATANKQLRKQLDTIGVTDRIVRYISEVSDISILQEG